MGYKHRVIKKRKIVIGGKDRIYSVIELPDFIRVRCYGCSKNTYAETFLAWTDSWEHQPYKPSLIALVYDCAIKNGWEPDKENSKIHIKWETILHNISQNTPIDST